MRCGYLPYRAKNSGLWVPGDTFNAQNAAGATTGTGGTPLTDLDLELFQLNAQLQPIALVDYSTSDIDNVQHIFTQLTGGIYGLEVLDRTPNQADTYALAWSASPVPEPASLGLLAVAIGCVMAQWAGGVKRKRSRESGPANQ